MQGSYSYPSKTLTGEVSKDIAFIEEIIGLKLALSDHREPFITKQELKRLAHSVRVSSMLANKPGIITLHMGDDENGLTLINEIINETSLPITLFRPTHVTRTDKLFEDSLEYLIQGGYIDITVGNYDNNLLNYLEMINKEDLSRVTFSSDGNGSFSEYDEFGNLVNIGVQSCDGILRSIIHLVNNGYEIEESLRFGTANVSKALKLKNKGFIEVGKDADILILDKDLNLDTIISLGIY